MAKRFEKGDAVYFPVKIAEIEYEDRWYDYVVRSSSVNGGPDGFPFCVKDNELKTAEEVAGLLKTEADATTVTDDSLQKENEELKAKCAEFLKTIGVQSDKLRELQARIAQLTDANDSLGKNRDSLNNEAAVHMTSIRNLQVAVDVLAEKIKEMRCGQDG
jgi:septal ring factor EnvC (AmiA/AmiB activator)